MTSSEFLYLFPHLLHSLPTVFSHSIYPQPCVFVGSSTPLDSSPMGWGEGQCLVCGHSQSSAPPSPTSTVAALLTSSVTTKPNRLEHLLDWLFSTLPHSSAGPQVSQTPHHLSLTCVFPADIRCHSCYKVPVLGCVDRQSCRLEPGQQCLTTNVYLGNIPLFRGERGPVGDSIGEG